MTKNIFSELLQGTLKVEVACFVAVIYFLSHGVEVSATEAAKAVAPAATEGSGKAVAEVEPKLSVKGNTLEVVPPTGHFFNLEAPNQAKEDGSKENLKITSKKEIVLVPIGKKSKKIVGKVFICDEKKSYCVDRKFEYVSEGKKKSDDKQAKESVHSSEPVEKSYFNKSTRFWVNAKEKAFEEAAKKKKLVFLDFYGIWCPPCNQLDYQVFSDSQFQKVLSDHFVALKIDSDLNQSQDLLKRYAIKYFPTLVVTTADGDEILRIIGFREKNLLTKTLLKAVELKDKSATKLLAQAEAGDKDSQIAYADLLLEQLDFASALKWYGPFVADWSKKENPQHLQLEKVYRAKHGKAETDEQKIEIIENWIRDFPETINAIQMYEELGGLYEKAKRLEEKKKLYEKAIVIFQKFSEKPDSEFVGVDFTKGDLYITAAGVYADLEKKDEANANYKKCIEYYGSFVTKNKGFARGEELNRAYCFRKSGQITEAEAIYKQGIKLFPKDFTFYNGFARMLMDDKKDLVESEKNYRLALQHAYGRQRPRTLLGLVKNLEMQKKFKDGVQMLDEELKSIEQSDSNYERLKKRKSEIEAKISTQ